MQNVEIWSEEFGAAADEPILLVMVEGMGHTLPPEVHEELAAAILAHTST
ncbi:hypothetical protein ACIHFD_47000 [Nonomuraea sp. NPDC051941]